MKAGVFVTARGDAMATGLTVGLGGVVGAAAGVAVDKATAGPATLAKGQLGYLALDDDAITLVQAKRGAFKPKATDTLVARAPRSQLQASRYKRGKMVGVFELRFTDGAHWAFDVGRAFSGSATELARALGSTME